MEGLLLFWSWLILLLFVISYTDSTLDVTTRKVKRFSAGPLERSFYHPRDTFTNPLRLNSYCRAMNANCRSISCDMCQCVKDHVFFSFDHGCLDYNEVLDELNYDNNCMYHTDTTKQTILSSNEYGFILCRSLIQPDWMRNVGTCKINQVNAINAWNGTSYTVENVFKYDNIFQCLKCVDVLCTIDHLQGLLLHFDIICEISSNVFAHTCFIIDMQGERNFTNGTVPTLPPPTTTTTSTTTTAATKTTKTTTTLTSSTTNPTTIQTTQKTTITTTTNLRTRSNTPTEIPSTTTRRTTTQNTTTQLYITTTTNQQQNTTYETQLASSGKKKTKNKLWISITAGCVILIGLVTVVMLFLYKRKTKQKKELHKTLASKIRKTPLDASQQQQITFSALSNDTENEYQSAQTIRKNIKPMINLNEENMYYVDVNNVYVNQSFVDDEKSQNNDLYGLSCTPQVKTKMLQGSSPTSIEGENIYDFSYPNPAETQQTDQPSEYTYIAPSEFETKLPENLYTTMNERPNQDAIDQENYTTLQTNSHSTGHYTGLDRNNDSMIGYDVDADPTYVNGDRRLEENNVVFENHLYELS